MRMMLLVMAVILLLDFVAHDTQSIVVWIWYFADGFVRAVRWYFYTV